MNVSLSKLASDWVALLALKMSFPIKNRRSAAALDEMAVLNLVNNSSALVPPTRCRQSGPPSVCYMPSNQVFARLCALILLVDLKLAELNLVEIGPLTVLKVSGTANPLVKRLALLISS